MAASSPPPAPPPPGGATGRRGLGGGGTLLLALAACAGRPAPPPPATARARGFVLDRAGAARIAGAVAGDLVLANDAARVLVGGAGRPEDRRGAVLGVQLAGAPREDEGFALAPLVYDGDRALAVTVRGVALVRRGASTGVRVEGVVRAGGRDREVIEDLSLTRDGHALAISTRVLDPPRDARVGARVVWGGAPTFAPGAGTLADDAWRDAGWVGASGDAASLALGFADEPLRVRATFEAHGHARFLAHTDVVAPRRVSADGRVAWQRAWLALGPGDLALPVRALGRARGRPYPELRVALPYAPPGATVQLFTADGRPLLRARPGPDGAVTVPVTPAAGAAPGARYAAVASAPGHHPSDAVAFRPGDDRALTLEIPRGGSLRIEAVDAARGTAIPARARVLGVEDTAPLDLGPEWRAAGARDVVVMPDGRATVPAPPGRYRVIVSRGPEWTLADVTVTVTETYRPTARAELARAVDPGEWVASDFHLHAAPSPDSRVSLEDRVAALAVEGVRFVVPTDHNHVTDYAPALRAGGYRDMGTAPGVEVTTWAPSFGHFNAYPVALDAARPGNGAPNHLHTSAAALFAAVRAAAPDALIQVNHPRLEGEIGYFDQTRYDPRTGAGAPEFSPDFDVLEVWNGFELGRPERLDQVFADWVGLLARGRRVVAAGNSDSHDVRFQWAGYPRTYVRVPGGRADRPGDLLAALRAGRAFVTSGPLLDATIDGRGPGETARVRGRVARVRVVVRAPPWMDVARVEVLVNGAVAVTEPVATPAPPPAPRFDRALEVPLPAPSPSPLFVIVRVVGERPLDLLLARDDAFPLAFTNPIWVERATRPR